MNYFQYKETNIVTLTDTMNNLSLITLSSATKNEVEKVPQKTDFVPKEILSHLFRYCPESWRAISRVCKLWKAACENMTPIAFPDLKQFHLENGFCDDLYVIIPADITQNDCIVRGFGIVAIDTIEQNSLIVMPLLKRNLSSVQLKIPLWYPISIIEKQEIPNNFLANHMNDLKIEFENISNSIEKYVCSLKEEPLKFLKSLQSATISSLHSLSGQCDSKIPQFLSSLRATMKLVSETYNHMRNRDDQLFTMYENFYNKVDRVIYKIVTPIVNSKLKLQ